MPFTPNPPAARAGAATRPGTTRTAEPTPTAAAVPGFCMTQPTVSRGSVICQRRRTGGITDRLCARRRVKRNGSRDEQGNGGRTEETHPSRLAMPLDVCSRELLLLVIWWYAVCLADEMAINKRLSEGHGGQPQGRGRPNLIRQQAVPKRGVSRRVDCMRLYDIGNHSFIGIEDLQVPASKRRLGWPQFGPQGRLTGGRQPRP